MFWILFVLMVNEVASLLSPREVDDDQRITNICHQIWRVREQRESLSLELKGIFIKCRFLKATDKHADVLTSKVDKYDSLRKMIVKKFASALDQTINVQKGNKWSDFDAYNNHQLIKQQIGEQDITDVQKLMDKDKLEKQMKNIRNRLYSARNELISDWQLDGYEEYEMKKSKGKSNKEEAKVEEKTPESMNAGSS